MKFHSSGDCDSKFMEINFLILMVQNLRGYDRNKMYHLQELQKLRVNLQKSNNLFHHLDYYTSF